MRAWRGRAGETGRRRGETERGQGVRGAEEGEDRGGLDDEFLERGVEGDAGGCVEMGLEGVLVAVDLVDEEAVGVVDEAVGLEDDVALLGADDLGEVRSSAATRSAAPGCAVKTAWRTVGSGMTTPRVRVVRGGGPGSAPAS